MHVLGCCLNHDEPKSNVWAHHNCLNLVCYEWTQAQNPMIELYLVWKPKIVSWIILSPTLEPIKGACAWSTSKAKSSQDACLPSVWSSHFKQIPKDHNQGSSLPSASPSHFKQIPFHHNQGSSIPNLKHPKWTKKASLHIWFATSWLRLKFFFFIPCFYVSLNFKNPCSIWCTLVMYIFWKNSKNKIKSRHLNLSKPKIIIIIIK